IILYKKIPIVMALVMFVIYVKGVMTIWIPIMMEFPTAWSKGQYPSLTHPGFATKMKRRYWSATTPQITRILIKPYVFRSLPLASTSGMEIISVHAMMHPA
ncbi:MAG TPA: hypothetical protein PKY06_09770, partial [Saprospiraceae bacterium]|nr:hypothetical protein [Saprospiraceae bacterium]